MKPVRIFKWIVCLLVIGWLAGSSTPARADVAPMEPPFGTNPQPGSEITNVRMMAETVLLDVHADGFAYVTASFLMRNLGEAEEKMDVGFPLDQMTWGRRTMGVEPFNPISDLEAWVGGFQMVTQTDYQTGTFRTPTGWVTETVPSWERFPVTFPPQQNVTIRITYTGEPYNDYKSGTYGYAYVLYTGAGWKDTIGSAEITVRLPYPINEYNYLRCYPDTCVVDGNELNWRYEDYEPGDMGQGVVEADFVPPPVWMAILSERINTEANPNDGEAWGRLGKAYKEALGGFRGYRWDTTDQEMYQWSVEAYQKALALLPNDADWHYGYAELLCTKASWNDQGNFEPEKVDWNACLEQVRQTLALDPDHAMALNLVHNMEQWLGNDFFTPSPTTDPNSTPSATLTRAPTRTKKPTFTPSVLPMHTLPPTELPTITPTKPSGIGPNASATTVKVAELPQIDTLTAEAVEPEKKASTGLPAGVVVGVGVVVVLVMGLWVVRRARG